MINVVMSKRKRPPRSARSRINQPRPSGQPARAPKSAPPGRGFWLYGTHAVAAALANPARRRHRFLATQQAYETLGDMVDGKPPDAEIVDRHEIDAVCGPDAIHQGLALLTEPLADVAIEDIVGNTGRARDIVVVLDQATDLRNIGAVMRSARAFGAHAVVMQDRNAPSETGVMAKAASGAMEYVALVRVTNLARALWTLKDSDYWCLGLDGHAESDIGEVSPTGRCALVLGAEGSGLRRLTRETCDQLVRIPIDADAESINLSNATAIALYAVKTAD